MFTTHMCLIVNSNNNNQLQTQMKSGLGPQKISQVNFGSNTQQASQQQQAQVQQESGRTAQFLRLIQDINSQAGQRAFCSTLFETAKNQNAVLLLQVVDVLIAVSDLKTPAILQYDYNQTLLRTLFKKEPFMQEPWFAEQWLVCLQLCIHFCIGRFPRSQDFKTKLKWLKDLSFSESRLNRVINAAVLISSGQLIRTPWLNFKKEIQIPLIWEPAQVHVLLSNLNFLNNCQGHEFNLKSICETLEPIGWKMVAPLVVSGVQTLTLMSKKKVASWSYVNPHGDISWIHFGREGLTQSLIFKELEDFADSCPSIPTVAQNIEMISQHDFEMREAYQRAMQHILGKRSNDSYIFSHTLVNMEQDSLLVKKGQKLMTPQELDIVKYRPSFNCTSTFSRGSSYATYMPPKFDSQSNQSEQQESEKESEDETSDLLVKRKAVHRRKQTDYEMLMDETSQTKRRKQSGQSQNQLSPGDLVAQASQIRMQSGQNFRQGTTQIHKLQQLKQEDQSMAPTNIYQHRTRQYKMNSMAANSQSDSSVEVVAIVDTRPNLMMKSSTSIKNASNAVALQSSANKKSQGGKAQQSNKQPVQQRIDIALKDTSKSNSKGNHGRN